MKLPSTVCLNVYKAYIHNGDFYHVDCKPLNAVNLTWDVNQPKPLRFLVLDSIVANWHNYPILSSIPEQADKNYLLENLDVNLPIKLLSKHIKDDIFWKRCFLRRWKNVIMDEGGKEWIALYMENDLKEMLETMEPTNYDPEEMQSILEVAAPHIQELDIGCLQPSLGEGSDHIPFDFILSNLPELKKFRISYITKNIGTHFYLGCSAMTVNDVVCLSRGLHKAYELREFCLVNTRLDWDIVKVFAKSLDKGCSNLTTLNLTSCSIGERGLMQWMQVLNTDSFSSLERLVLVNNFFTHESALLLSRVIRKRSIKYLDLSLNPIGSEGVATIFSILGKLPIKSLNVSGCSINHSIRRLLLKLIVENHTLLDLDVSNNELGKDLGVKIYKFIGFNKVLKRLDLRNTGVTTQLRRNINAVLFENRDKLE